MSNYTKSTNFATKDALASGNPLKIVKGTEIDTEFNNIATAISTKVDSISPTITSATLITPALGTPTSGTLTNCTSLPIDGGTTGILPVSRGGTGVTTSTGSGSNVLSASPTFTGTPEAPTASSGTNTTQIATTAFVQTAISAAPAFPSGTAMLFVQTSAPTGWTKSTTHNDKTLRVVSGAASSGGSSAFSTVFSNQTPTISNTFSVSSTTLTTSQIPSHTHTVPGTSGCPGAVLGVTVFGTAGGGPSIDTTATGGGGSHNHSLSGSATSSAITLNVQYVDVIIATKN